MVFWLTVIVQAYGFLRVGLDGFDLARYRMDFYESAGGIFKSNYLFTLYNVFLMPLFVVAVMYWLNKDLRKKQVKRLVLFAFLVIVLDGVLRLGRFQYLYVIFFFYLSYKAFGFKKVALFFIAMIGLVISFLTIYFRQFFVDSSVESALDIANGNVFQASIVSYQYNGYIFLDHLVGDKSFFGHPWEMNTGSFFFLFLKTLTTKVGVDFNYPWEHYNILLTDGLYFEKLDLYFNAFTTNFLPVYLDLGYFGIFIYGLFSGIFLGFRSNSIIVKTFQYLNLFILIFGLYQPIITTLPGFILLKRVNIIYPNRNIPRLSLRVYSR
jgi:oligosaccharide repeat unit polymerase